MDVNENERQSTQIKIKEHRLYCYSAFQSQLGNPQQACCSPHDEHSSCGPRPVQKCFSF